MGNRKKQRTKKHKRGVTKPVAAVEKRRVTKPAAAEKRRVIQPVPGLDVFVDSKDWEIVVDFAGKWWDFLKPAQVCWLDIRFWALTMARLAEAITVDPNDDAKRITEFRTPEFLKKVLTHYDGVSARPDPKTIPELEADVFALDFHRVSSLERLSLLYLTGVKVSPSLPGLRRLKYLREVKIDIIDHDMNDRHIDLFDEICRLPNLKILLVSGYPHLLSYLTSERGLDNQGPDLEVLFMNWNLEIKNLTYAQRELVAKPDFFAGRFVNLKTLDLGIRREFNTLFGSQFIRCSWISTRLETLIVDLDELNESLPKLESDPSEVDAFHVQVLTIHVQTTFLDQQYGERETILSSVLERVARWMKSIRVFCLMVCNHSYWPGRQPPRTSCNFFDLPLSKLYPLKSTLECLLVYGGANDSPDNEIEEIELKFGYVFTMQSLLAMPRCDRRPKWVSRWIPKIRLEDLYHFSSLKSVEFYHFDFDDTPLLKSDVSSSEHGNDLTAEFHNSGFGDTSLLESNMSHQHGNDLAESAEIARSHKTTLGAREAKPSVNCVSMSQPPHEGFPVLRKLALYDWKFFADVRLLVDIPGQPAAQRAKKTFDFLASLDLSQLREFKAYILSQTEDPIDIQAVCQKVFSKCSRLQILLFLHNWRSSNGDAFTDTLNAVLACPSKELQRCHLGHHPCNTDQPTPSAIKALWSVATKFPLLCDTRFGGMHDPSWKDEQLLHQLALNLARLKLSLNGWPRLPLWPLILSHKNAFRGHPHVIEKETDIKDADAVYMLLRNFLVEML